MTFSRGTKLQPAGSAQVRRVLALIGLFFILGKTAVAEASPQRRTSSGKTPLVASSLEPKGLRLRWFSYTGKSAPEGIDPRQMWLWGVTKPELLTQLGSPKPWPLCYKSDTYEGVERCIFSNPDAGTWYADFGDDFYEVDAQFFNGAFYTYSVRFPEHKFDFVKQTLKAALKHAGASSVSTVSNRMGAKFDQETVLWLGQRTMVYLEQRGDKVDEGLLQVTFLPIAKLAPVQPKAGKAPF